MKSTKDKKVLAVQRYKDGKPTYEIALEMHVTRATLYRWLNEEGVTLDRSSKKGERYHSSACGVLAERMGVSMPTARKYMRAVSDFKLQGRGVSLEDLKKVGIGAQKQKIVVAFLEKEGYVYEENSMALRNLAGTGDRWLVVDEVVELFTDPGRFLGEKSTGEKDEP